MQKYRPRIADKILSEKLDAMGAILIEGAKYCGKTTLCKQQAKSAIFMTDPDTLNQNLIMAQMNISRVRLKFLQPGISRVTEFLIQHVFYIRHLVKRCLAYLYGHKVTVLLPAEKGTV